MTLADPNPWIENYPDAYKQYLDGKISEAEWLYDQTKGYLLSQRADMSMSSGDVPDKRNLVYHSSSNEYCSNNFFKVYEQINGRVGKETDDLHASISAFFYKENITQDAINGDIWRKGTPTRDFYKELTGTYTFEPPEELMGAQTRFNPILLDTINSILSVEHNPKLYNKSKERAQHIKTLFEEQKMNAEAYLKALEQIQMEENGYYFDGTDLYVVYRNSPSKKGPSITKILDENKKVKYVNSKGDETEIGIRERIQIELQRIKQIQDNPPIKMHISRNPADILRKSDCQRWQSCESASGGYRGGRWTDIEQGNAIAYMTVDEQPLWNARFVLRRCDIWGMKDEDKNTESLGIEPTVYPQSKNIAWRKPMLSAIAKTLRDKGHLAYMDELQAMCITTYKYGGYSDTNAYTSISPSREHIMFGYDPLVYEKDGGGVSYVWANIPDTSKAYNQWMTEKVMKHEHFIKTIDGITGKSDTVDGEKYAQTKSPQNIYESYALYVPKKVKIDKTEFANNARIKLMGIFRQSAQYINAPKIDGILIELERAKQKIDKLIAENNTEGAKDFVREWFEKSVGLRRILTTLTGEILGEEISLQSWQSVDFTDIDDNALFLYLPKKLDRVIKNLKAYDTCGSTISSHSGICNQIAIQIDREALKYSTPLLMSPIENPGKYVKALFYNSNRSYVDPFIKYYTTSQTDILNNALELLKKYKLNILLTNTDTQYSRYSGGASSELSGVVDLLNGVDNTALRIGSPKYMHRLNAIERRKDKYGLQGNVSYPYYSLNTYNDTNRMLASFAGCVMHNAALYDTENATDWDIIALSLKDESRTQITQSNLDEYQSQYDSDKRYINKLLLESAKQMKLGKNTKEGDFKELNPIYDEDSTIQKTLYGKKEKEQPPKEAEVVEKCFNAIFNESKSYKWDILDVSARNKILLEAIPLIYPKVPKELLTRLTPISSSKEIGKQKTLDKGTAEYMHSQVITRLDWNQVLSVKELQPYAQAIESVMTKKYGSAWKPATNFVPLSKATVKDITYMLSSQKMSPKVMCKQLKFYSEIYGDWVYEPCKQTGLSKFSKPIKSEIGEVYGAPPPDPSEKRKYERAQTETDKKINELAERHAIMQSIDSYEYKFGVSRTGGIGYDALCSVCGVSYGSHSGSVCPGNMRSEIEFQIKNICKETKSDNIHCKEFL